jgi:hypothetical protein
VVVNEVTQKLTDGEMSLTPACHGKWGGYKTEQALAWVMEAGWPWGKVAWYARCKDRSFGPTNLRLARRAAEAFVTGASLPQDKGARAFTGPVDLNVEPVRANEISDSKWINWSPDEGAP